MTNKEYKKQLEKHHITPIINHLNISWEDVEIGDEPDVIIRNYEGKIIGLYFVENSILEEKFSDYPVIDVEDTYYRVDLLLSFNLVKEEKDIHAFVPTYLRSGV